MMRRGPDLVVAGQVVLAAEGGRLETTEAIAIHGGRVVAAGPRTDLLATATALTRVIDEPGLAVVPGLHDFHLHLVGMARVRRELRLDGMTSPALLEAIADGARRSPPGGWLRGRGWSEAAMSPTVVERLNQDLEEVPALLYSHDAHSAWASPAALRHAGLDADSRDLAGGRIERDARGVPTGVLRERATDPVEAISARLGGVEALQALDEVLAELAGWGVTGATDAGDTSADNGVGRFAALGDRASLLLDAADRLDGRLRLAVGFPAAAMAGAARLGLVTGQPLAGMTTLRAGWAKAYADGALGSRTAACFEPYTCGPRDSGILRLDDEDLDELLRRARRHRIGLAVHAIGDRAGAVVLDAMERAARPGSGVPRDRIEHLQLLRPDDPVRLATLDVTASLQPVHCAADRPLVEACWADRAHLTYPWRSLDGAGARLAFGSDAPIETANPWLGIFAGVHRRLPDDGTLDWQPHQALTAARALEAYTRGPAAAAGRSDEGHLRPGALADLAVLNVDLRTLLAADERLATVRSLATMVEGREVHRA